MVGGLAEGDEGLEELRLIDAALTSMGISDAQARFDPAIVRGLEYYTGAVFEAEILQNGPDGEPLKLGSVGGGGRYDDLVARFTGERTPATGFSFGVSRLAIALRQLALSGDRDARGPVVVVTALDQTRMADYFAIARELRDAGIAAEVYLGRSGMKPQMKYADRRRSPATVIIGSDEWEAGQVTIKDLDVGRAMAAKTEDRQAWKDERPGQVTLPRDQMVAALREIIARG